MSKTKMMVTVSMVTEMARDINLTCVVAIRPLISNQMMVVVGRIKKTAMTIEI